MRDFRQGLNSIQNEDRALTFDQPSTAERAAELLVIKNDPRQFEVLKEYSVADSPTWAHPVVLGNRILIKDASTLALWSLE